MIRAFNQQGTTASGELLAQISDRAENIRQLAYRLYTLCERKGRAEDARAYNELINAWLDIFAASQEAGHRSEQLTLF